MSGITISSQREVTFAFYRVKGLDDGDCLKTRVDEFIRNHVSVSSRNYPVKTDFVRIQNYSICQDAENSCYGNFIRTKPGERPNTVRDDDERISDIQLQPGETLAFWQSFYYVHKYKIMVIQRNARVASHRLFSDYLSFITGRNISLSPVLDAST